MQKEKPKKQKKTETLTFFSDKLTNLCEEMMNNQTIDEGQDY